MENIVALYRSESLEAYFEPVELPDHGARTFGHKESCSIAVTPQYSVLTANEARWNELATRSISPRFKELY
jgi:hypothetical protein